MSSKMQTTVVNLLGGPGSGKSTTAAGVFYELKKAGHSVELVREYVKDWAWRGIPIQKYDEVYLFSKQLRAESALYGKVEFIVTDSPLYMSVAYEKMYTQHKMMERLWRHYIREQQKGDIVHEHFHVVRTKPYVQAGRYQSEEEAKKVDRFFTWAAEVHSVQDVLDSLI